MIQSREDLKKYFQTGDKPTEAQFMNWHDSYIHKEDEVPITNIKNLEAVLLEKVDKNEFNQFTQNVKYNLSTTPAVLHYKYNGEIVRGVLLQIPSIEGDKYIFNHNLNITKYLQLQVWQDGLSLDDPKLKARQDLTELVYKPAKGIGDAKVGDIEIGAEYDGSIQLSNNKIEVSGQYRFSDTTFLYVEYLSNKIVVINPIGNQK